ESGQAVEAVVAEPPTVRESRKRGPEGVDTNAPPKSLRRDHTDRPSDIRAQFSGLQVSNERLSQQVAVLQEQVSGEEKLKAAFEEFKR
nr:hypothetical protein [Tanacetum cinerariifolium]